MVKYVIPPTDRYDGLYADCPHMAGTPGIHRAVYVIKMSADWLALNSCLDICNPRVHFVENSVTSHITNMHHALQQKWKQIGNLTVQQIKEYWLLILL